MDRFAARLAARSKPLPPCGEGVGDGGVGAGLSDFAQANLNRRRYTPTPDPSPQGGGEPISGPTERFRSVLEFLR
jgi:hypothetical protein